MTEEGQQLVNDSNDQVAEQNQPTNPPESSSQDGNQLPGVDDQNQATQTQELELNVTEQDGTETESEAPIPEGDTKHESLKDFYQGFITQHPELSQLLESGEASGEEIVNALKKIPGGEEMIQRVMDTLDDLREIFEQDLLRKEDLKKIVDGNLENDENSDEGAVSGEKKKQEMAELVLASLGLWLKDSAKNSSAIRFINAIFEGAGYRKSGGPESTSSAEASGEAGFEEVRKIIAEDPDKMVKALLYIEGDGGNSWRSDEIRGLLNTAKKSDKSEAKKILEVVILGEAEDMEQKISTNFLAFLKRDRDNKDWENVSKTLAENLGKPGIRPSFKEDLDKFASNSSLRKQTFG